IGTECWQQRSKGAWRGSWNRTQSEGPACRAADRERARVGPGDTPGRVRRVVDASQRCALRIGKQLNHGLKATITARGVAGATTLRGAGCTAFTAAGGAASGDESDGGCTETAGSQES